MDSGIPELPISVNYPKSGRNAFVDLLEIDELSLLPTLTRAHFQNAPVSRLPSSSPMWRVFGIVVSVSSISTTVRMASSFSRRIRVENGALVAVASVDGFRWG